MTTHTSTQFYTVFQCSQVHQVVRYWHQPINLKDPYLFSAIWCNSWLNIYNSVMYLLGQWGGGLCQRFSYRIIIFLCNNGKKTTPCMRNCIIVHYNVLLQSANTLLEDRFKSLQKRNIIEPRSRTRYVYECMQKASVTVLSEGLVSQYATQIMCVNLTSTHEQINLFEQMNIQSRCSKKNGHVNILTVVSDLRLPLWVSVDNIGFVPLLCFQI